MVRQSPPILLSVSRFPFPCPVRTSEIQKGKRYNENQFENSCPLQSNRRRHEYLPDRSCSGLLHCSPAGFGVIFGAGAVPCRDTASGGNCQPVRGTVSSARPNRRELYTTFMVRPCPARLRSQRGGSRLRAPRRCTPMERVCCAGGWHRTGDREPADASLWAGEPRLFRDLNPLGFTASRWRGVVVGQEVGFAMVP